MLANRPSLKSHSPQFFSVPLPCLETSLSQLISQHSWDVARERHGKRNVTYRRHAVFPEKRWAQNCTTCCLEQLMLSTSCLYRLLDAVT